MLWLLAQVEFYRVALALKCLDTPGISGLLFVFKESPGDKLKVAQAIPVPRMSSLPSSSVASVTSHSKDVLLHAKAKFSNQSRRILLGESGGKAYSCGESLVVFNPVGFHGKGQ